MNFANQLSKRLAQSSFGADGDFQFPAGYPQTLVVVTNDPGPQGALNVRSAPNPDGPVLGSYPHTSPIKVYGPAVNGWYPVEWPPGSMSPDAGWASASYISPPGQTPAAAPPPNAPATPTTVFTEFTSVASSPKKKWWVLGGIGAAVAVGLSMLGGKKR